MLVKGAPGDNLLPNRWNPKEQRTTQGLLQYKVFPAKSNSQNNSITDILYNKNSKRLGSWKIEYGKIRFREIWASGWYLLSQRPLIMCMNFVFYRVWYSGRNIPRKLCQYHSCWCPGSLCHQVISIFDIDYSVSTGLCLHVRKVTSNCGISVYYNRRKFKHIYPYLY